MTAVTERPPWVSSVVARRISSPVATLPSSKAAIGSSGRTTPALRSAPSSIRRLRAPSPGLGRGDRDRRRREHARHRGEVDRVPDPERPDEARGDQRPGDGAEIVARALEPVGAPVRLARRERGEHRVARRGAHAARDPGRRAREPHLPDGAGEADRAGGGGRDEVAARRHPQPRSLVVRPRARDEL
ncbi:MAG TPA: hypothetical protein VFL66_00515, partial [Gaiellaceae bacterium]|nr:hypothetical protein [Gaiellaceae bacterium]